MPVFRAAASAASFDAGREMDEAEVRELMWKSVGLFRDRAGLLHAVNQLQAQASMLEGPISGGRTLDHEGWRRASIVTVAYLIAKAALRREESRGGHFRTDFPAHDDSRWNVHISDVIHHS